MPLTPEEQRELEELEAMEAQGMLGGQPQMQQAVSGLTPEEAQELAILEQMEASGELHPEEDIGRAARVGIERGVTFGARPAIAGVGAALGAGVGALQAGRPISEAFEMGGEAFGEARQEAIAEQERLEERFPKTALAGEVVGGLATAPLTPVRGLVGAAKLGAAAGVGRAVGEAEDIEEAVKTVAVGTVSGVAGDLIAKGGLKSAKAVGRFVRKRFPKEAATRLASDLTGVRGKQIQDFASKTKKVTKLIKEVGGEFQGAVDDLRTETLGEIDKFKGDMNKMIGDALDAAGDERIVPIKEVVDSMQSIKGGLSKKTHAEAIGKIDDIIAEIERVGGRKQGRVSLREMNDLKQFLFSKTKFLQEGKMFDKADPVIRQVRRAAKQGASKAREAIEAIDASGNIAKANKQLSELHDIEDKMMSTLLKPGKAPSSILGAGAGTGQANRETLRRIGELTGSDVLGKAEELAVAKAFTDPSLLPVDVTGKSAVRIGLTILGGGALGGPQGAAMAAAMSSPAALKKAIEAGDISADAIRAVLKKLESPAARAAFTRQGAEIGNRLTRAKARLKKELKKAPKSKARKPVKIEENKI